ncbi:dTDP-glucose 4,6-dehydratase [Elioraea tepida]|jgi:dTDP-glucose 4,6-dehydratase|uniref:dTDP-glucose 4,6-dehydratase n=1 Tax=Elioraea tepida TaxID=2843330 RepID=A0A975U1D2_9PROT|nr:dTDP-glucose 4,6-dehydratase [Elioraea tepida]QXM24560.1 dTDP-glucose 4,6-dehydratase [Elioraea tepida]
MKILVTGGMGFIGSAVIRRLIRTTGATVVNVDCLTYAASPEAIEEAATNPRHVHVNADIADAAAMRAVFAAHDPDAVMHLAAESHVDRSIDGPAAFVRTNVTGTLSLLEAALAHWRRLPKERADAFRFHHVSTDEVFGHLEPGDPPFTAATPYAPRSPYAASKAASDHLVRAFHATYGLPAFVTNTCNNYGPWQFPEKLIPLTIANAIEGRRLPVYGRGENIRDWIHVDDHAAGLVAALFRARPGETYLLGAHAERRNIDVVRAICAILDRLMPHPAGPRERLIEFVADRPGHDFRYAIDAAPAMASLGWRPVHSFESGLESTVRWYVDHAGWWKAIRARRYAGERLGTAA